MQTKDWITIQKEPWPSAAHSRMVNYSLTSFCSVLFATVLFTFAESKQWSLKDLRSSKIFQTLECDLKKVSSLPCSSIDLDRSLELVANLESTGAKTEVEAKPAPTPFITKLRPMEPEINNHRTEVEVKPTPTPFVPKVRTVEPVITKPIPKVQPVNPQVKYQPPAPARKSEEPPQQPSNNNFFRSAKEQLVRNCYT